MYNSSFRTRLFVIVLLLLLLSPLAVHAAGLGKLTLNSALGQPLQAEIDIVSANNDELSSLKVELASHDAFTQAGIRYESFFSTFNVRIESRDNGEPYVIITSPESINEPFLNILVELSWASGRLLREYTVLLDPIEYDRPAPVAPTVRSAPPAIETTADVPAQTPQVDNETASSLSEPEPAPATVASRSDTYGPVARGDTLSSIVRNITPEGADLNQMLVAMYRANREAFIDNNMNLLRVGVLLRIPDSSEIMEIDAAEANAEVKIQVADWRSYREKLVEAANEAQPSEVLSQADSGQITTSVDNNVATLNGGREEVLRLSSGDTQGEGSDTSMMDRLRMTEEDAIAHSLALQEANERVAMLEKQVEDLQQLLELQQPDLAQAQYQAEGISEIDAKPESDALEIITSSPELILEEEFEFAPEQEVNEHSDSFMNETIQDSIVAPDSIIEETIPDVTNPTPLPIEGEASYMDLIMGNIEYVIGALLALLGILFLIKRRQEKSEEADMDDMDFGDAPASIRNKMAAVAAAETASSIDSDNLSPDSSEAIESKNANALQAEETQEAGFEKDTNFFPNEKDYDAQSNENMDLTVESPQETEDELNDEFRPDHEIELDLGDASSPQDKGIEFEEVMQDSDQVEPAAEMDLDLIEEVASEEDSIAQSEEDHEIEFDLGDLDEDKTKSEQEETGSELMDTDAQIEQSTEPVETAEPAEPGLAESTSDESANSDDQIDLVVTKLTESPEDLKDVAEALDYNLNFDLDGETKSSDTSESVVSSSQETGPNNIHFEHDTSAIELPNDNASIEIEEPVVNEAPIIEVDEAEIDKTSADDVDVNEQPPELDLADINLDMENEQITGEAKLAEESSEQLEIAEDAPEATEKNELWHEVETKMDLAMAYQEMDDKEGAREMFEEVMRDGDEQQQEKAKAFLDEL